MRNNQLTWCQAKIGSEEEYLKKDDKGEAIEKMLVPEEWFKREKKDNIMHIELPKIQGHNKKCDNEMVEVQPK